MYRGVGVRNLRRCECAHFPPLRRLEEKKKNRFRKIESKMANFKEIFHTGFPRIHTNAKSPENICLKDFSILTLFVT